MLRTQSDARLVDLVRAGHASAFEAIVQRYRKQLLAYCSRLLPASRAEDAVQQSFLKAYQAMVSGDAELNLRPWLYRIAHNASLNLLRQNGWSHEQLDENMDGVQRPDQAFDLHERLRSTVTAVNALPERQRNAVLLREIEGLSYEQIALALGVGDGAVRQLLHRARATLRAGMTAVTPVGLAERLSTALAASGGDPSARVGEVAAGVGLGAGAAKLGAAVLATGVIATGAVTVPLHQSRHGKAARATADESSLSSPSSSGSSSSTGAPATNVDDHRSSGSGSSGHHGSSHRGRHHGASDGEGKGSGSGDHHGSSRQNRSGDGGGSGSGEHHSGSGGSDRQSGSGADGGGDRHGGSGGSGDQSGSGGESHGGDSGDGGTVMLPGQETEQHKSGDDNPTAVTPTGVTDPVVGESGEGRSGSDGGSDGSGTSGG